MIAGFDWWLLLVGIVGGAGLVWLVVADFRRREEDIATDEQSTEADWIARAITEAGRPVGPETVEDVLRLHRAYLAGPVPELHPSGTEGHAEGDGLAPTDGAAAHDAQRRDVGPAGSRGGDAPAMESHRPQT